MSSSTGAPAVAPGDEVAERRLRRDRLMTTLSGFAVFGLAFATGPILARSLGVSGRGAVAAVLIPTQVLGWMLMLGIPQATAYFARIRHDRQLIMSSWVVTLVVGVPVITLIWPFVPALLSRLPAGDRRLLPGVPRCVPPGPAVHQHDRSAARVGATFGLQLLPPPAVHRQRGAALVAVPHRPTRSPTGPPDRPGGERGRVDPDDRGQSHLAGTRVPSRRCSASS